MFNQIRSRLLALSLGSKVGLGLMVGGGASYQIGKVFAIADIEQTMRMGQPLLMNTPPEMAMVFGCFAVVAGFIGLIGNAKSGQALENN